MCIATVYVDAGNGREEVMRDVISVEPENDGILLTSILGEEKLLQASIRNIAFLKHSVVVEPRGQQLTGEALSNRKTRR
ncbi:MAG: CooT family nickel-binding protein [Chloroflexi bacterium]|nr:CooT family nickel-binding protein [Chloroflexota bacterium]